MLGDQPAELVHVFRLSAHDHVIRPRHVLGLHNSGDLGDLPGHVGGLADLRLDEDVSLYHAVLLGQCLSGIHLLPHATLVVQTRCVNGALIPTKDPTAAPPAGPAQGLSAPTVASVGEFGLIGAISSWLPPPGARTLTGIGDDAAVLATPDGRVVATTDFLLEGRHFRRDWSSATDVGHKAAARSLADVAAMGAVPSALLVALAVPGDLPVSWARELTAGLTAECARVGGPGAAVIGGGHPRGERGLP